MKEVRSKNTKLLLLSLIFSIAVIAAILYLTVNEKTFSYLENRTIDPIFFLLAIVAQITTWFIWGLRISFMSDIVDPEHKVGFIEGTKIAIANLFLAAITPSMAGGEPVRIHLLSKKGFNAGHATSIVLGERIFDAIFILAMVPFALIVFQGIISIKIIKIGLILGIFLFTIGIALFFYTIARPNRVESFFHRLNKRYGRKYTIIKKMGRLVKDFHNGGSLIFRKENLKDVLLILLITASSWFIGFLIPSLILIGLGHKPILLESIAAQILLVVIIMIPTTPGSSGVAEGGASLLYGAMVNTSILGIFIILWRFVTYYLNIIVSGLFQYKVLKSIIGSK